MDDQSSIPAEAAPSAEVPSAADHVATPPGSPWLRRGVVAGLLLLHVLLANAGTWNKGPTFDETAHIGNGFSFWATGDYRLSPDSIVPQRWMTFPLYLFGYQAPPMDGEIWFKGDNWGYGRSFLYERGNDAWSMLHLARFMNSLWNVGTGLIVYVWAAYLFGVSGGLVALILYLFNPTVLAHGSSITGDAAATFSLAASIAALWCLLQMLTPRTVIVSCLVIGLAFVTKFSAVLLVPVGVMMAVIRVASRRPWPYRFFGREGMITSWWAQPLVLLGLVVMHVVAAWILIWCLFGFRYEQMLNVVPGRDVLYTGDWDQVLKAGSAPMPGSQQERNGALLAIIEFARAHRLLPEAYLYVFTSSVSTTSARSSFLNGRYGIFGFPSFFPYCFAYKTPIAALCLIIFAWAAHVMRRIHQIRVEGQSPLRLLWNGFYATAPLWCLLFVYWYFSITRGINIGVRHIMPTFPATFILVGAAGAWLYGLGTRWFTLGGFDAADEARFAAQTTGFRKLMQAAVCGFLLLLVGDVLLAFPNYLAYFNRLAGGSSEGYRHLVDSSLDWGQELPNLKKWLDKNVNNSSTPPKVYISYMGSTPPSVHGVDGTWLPCYFAIQALEPGKRVVNEIMLSPGVYCISASMLQNVYNSFFPGPWRKDYEHNYRVLFELMKIYVQTTNNPQARAEILAKSGLPNWETAVAMYEWARFGRLTAFLRKREPDAMINYAILIYRVTNEDLKRALLEPPVELYDPPITPGGNVPY